MALCKNMVAITAAVAISTALVLALTASTLIPVVFGLEFLPAVTIALLLLIATVLRAINDSIAAGLKGMGKPTAVMLAELLGVCVGIPALAALVPRFGLVGAGLAAIAGSAVSSTASVTLLLRHHDISVAYTVNTVSSEAES